MKIPKRKTVKYPSLWFHERYNHVRILYPSGRVEYFNLKWKKSVYSSKHYLDALMELTFLGHTFVSYL